MRAPEGEWIGNAGDLVKGGFVGKRGGDGLGGAGRRQDVIGLVLIGGQDNRNLIDGQEISTPHDLLRLEREDGHITHR